MYLAKRNLHLLLVYGLFGAAPLWAVELKEAEITALKNIVEHDTGDGKGAAPAKASEKIFEKSKVSTAAASMAELTFADTSITRVGANTSFSFQSKERLVKLEKGTVLINTPPGAGGATVDCGGVTAAVTGTTFMASVDGNGNKMFVLLEGAGGMKVTAGGKTTMVRAGQAASVGGGEGGSKKEDSGGGPGEKKAGGDQPAGDKKEGGGDKTGGGDSPKPKADGPGAKGETPSDGGGKGGKPPAAPTIQVFDVDVQKVVASTPLIQAFDKPLPSAQKIQATVDVQQAKMSEGKMESLGVEIVAVKADGDVLVGAPKVVAEAPPKKEEPKADAPAKKEDVVAKKEDGGMKPEPKADGKMAGGPAPDNLDISTAAGPGAGAPPAPTGTSIAAATPPPPPAAPSIPAPPINIGQIINQRPLELAPVALTLQAKDFARAFGAPNPDFGFSITAGGLLAGHSVVTDLRTTANNFSEVSGGPFGITFEGLRILDGSGGNVTGRYNLTKVSGALTIFRAEQRVNFALPGSLTFGDDTGLFASKLDSAKVSFEVVSGPATINASGKLVATSGTGKVVVRAVTVGDGNYLGANAEQTINLAKAGQRVNFALPGSLTFGDDTGLFASKLDSAVVSFEVVSGPARIDAGKLVATSGTGNVVVRAVTLGDGNYLGANAEQTINLAKAGQRVNFALPSNLTFGENTGLIATKLDSALVSFEVVSGPARIDDGKLVATSGTGSVVVRAVTLGDGNYLGANAEQTINLAKAGQSVSFGLPASLTFGNDTGLFASKLDSAKVSFEVVSGPATIDASGKLVATSGTGTVVVRAVTPGDANYRGAEAQQTINLAKAGQTLSFGNGPALSLSTGETYFAPIPTGGLSGLNLSILETDGRAVLGSDSITIGKIYGAKSFTLQANAFENANYLEAQKDLVIQIKEDQAGIVLNNPLRVLASAYSIPLITAFDKYFYFVGAVPGSTGALEKYFINAPGVYDPVGTASQYIQLANTQKVELATAGEIQDFDFFTAQAIKMTDQNGNDNVVLKDSLSLTPLRKDLLFYANQVLLGKQTAGFSGSTVPLAMDDSFMEFWDGGWRDWAVLGGSVEGGVNLKLPDVKERVEFVAGTGGISIQGVTVGANSAALAVLTSGNLLVQAASFLDLSPAQETSFQAMGLIQMGATSDELVALETNAGSSSTGGKVGSVTLGSALLDNSSTAQVSNPAQEALQETKQVRIVSKAGEAFSSGIAVIRSATGLEMRDVVIRGFGEIELAKGLDSSAPRVLVSGSSVRDFKIKELVGAFINADSKIQMAALDASGELAGTMVVYNGLPVNRQLAGVLDKTITDSRKNLLVDAQTISLAAKRLEFQNTTMAAMTAITARANTVLLNNANFTVISQNGMINFYTQQGLVNRTYGSDGASDNGMLNFSGVNNFRIGNNSFTVQDQATLNQHYGSNILDVQQNGNRPEAGKVNVLKM